MRYYILLIFMLTGRMVLGQGSETAEIVAYGEGWKGAIIVLKTSDEQASKTLISDTFRLSILKAETGFAELSVRLKNKIHHTRFFVEPGTITIQLRGNDLIPSGTTLNDRYSYLLRELDSVAASMTFKKADQKIFLQNRTASLVEEDPSSPIGLRMLYDHFYLDESVSDTLYHRLFYSLSNPLQKSELGQKMKSEVDMRYVSAQGRPIAFLDLPDAKKTLKPVYEKGQLTLIHFWASWCAPCHRSNEILREIYLTDSSRIKLVGVGLDENYSTWTNAIRKEGLAWTQLNDLKGWKSKAVSAFNVRSLPYNILVDDKGIIIARNVTRERLDEYLMGIGLR